MLDDAAVRNGVERIGVAVDAAVVHQAWLWHGWRQRVRELPRRGERRRAWRRDRGAPDVRVAPDVVVPVQEPSVGVETRLHVDHGRGPVRLPRVLLLAGQDDAHRASGRTREQCGVERGVVCSVVAVAARRLDVPHAHSAGFDPQGLRDMMAETARRIDALRIDERPIPDHPPLWVHRREH